TPASHRFGQTFTAPENNVGAISLLMGKLNQATMGQLVLHLRQSPKGKDDLRRVSVPLSEIANNQWHTFYFDPIPDSAGQSYFFVMELVGTPPRQPLVVLWTATEDLLPGGKRYEGTVPVTGDLCMKVSVPDEK